MIVLLGANRLYWEESRAFNAQASVETLVSSA